MSINKDSQKAPNLRFKGFTDDWEQRKLSDLIQTMRGGASIAPNDYKDTGVATVPKGAINPTGVADLSGSKYVSKKFFEKNENSTVTSGGLVTSLRDLVPSAPNMGRIVKVKGKCQRYLMPQGVYSILLQDKVDENFLISFSNTSKFRKIISKEKNGSTQVHIRNSEYLGITIDTPGIEEQNQIGNFLKQLDNAITLHQRKLDQLNRLKEALLQQMFPGKGETVPKLRFAGFEGDWEERKLSALFIKGGSGGTPKSTNKDFYEGNIPFLGISDITKSNGFINNTEKHISVDGLNNSAAWVVPRGSISLAMYASVGKVAVLNIDVATSQAFYNMVFDDDDLRDFVYQCLIKANELSEWNKLISTGTQANLNADKVKNFMLYLPQNHAEIKLISAFLKQFDTTIAIQQRKLDQLKNMKQVLLENMFI